MKWPLNRATGNVFRNSRRVREHHAPISRVEIIFGKGLPLARGKVPNGLCKLQSTLEMYDLNVHVPVIVPVIIVYVPASGITCNRPFNSANITLPRPMADNLKYWLTSFWIKKSALSWLSKTLIGDVTAAAEHAWHWSGQNLRKTSTFHWKHWTEYKKWITPTSGP